MQLTYDTYRARHAHQSDREMAVRVTPGSHVRQATFTQATRPSGCLREHTAATYSIYGLALVRSVDSVISSMQDHAGAPLAGPSRSKPFAAQRRAKQRLSAWELQTGVSCKTF